MRIGLKYWAKPPSLWTILPCIALMLLMMLCVSSIGGEYGPYPIELRERVVPIVLGVVVIDLLIRVAALLGERHLGEKRQHRRYQRGHWRWFVFPFCVLIVGSFHLYNWPLKLRFELSRAELERAAMQVRSTGKKHWHPRWIGFYRVTTIQLTNDAWDDRPNTKSEVPPNVWLFTGWWHTSSLTGPLHYDHGVSFLYRDVEGAPPDSDPGEGAYHLELADPPWYIYY